MIPGKDLLISFGENARRASIILAIQQPVTYAEALVKVQRLKGYSKVNHELKKSRNNS